MDVSRLDDQRDFIARQYASLIALGLSEESAHARLREVLGAAAVTFLGDPDGAGAQRPDGTGVADRVVDAARRLGGNAANAQAELIRSLAEARLLALDWWRPIRTFLLYALLLLGLATVITSIYLAFVLPAFGSLDQTMGVHGGGASGLIMSDGAIRLLAPLVAMAIALATLANLWFRMRLRMARFEPLGATPRAGWLHGRSGTAFQTLRCLEFAAAIRAAGVADASVLEPAVQAAGWPAPGIWEAAGNGLGEKLRQAERLGTFGAELEWQRRLHWTTTQAQLELSRDRLILFSRVLLYILIGIMVMVFYLPIFSIANTIGVQ